MRSRKGKEIDREKARENGKERDSNRPPTDAEIIAVGAGLAKLARDQNKHDLKSSSRNEKRAELVAVKETSVRRGNGPNRGLGLSKVSHGSDTLDEDGWESASDDGSESSVDSRLAFGADTGGNWFGWGSSRPQPQSRKSSVVDPRQFGPANSLHGIVTEPVGFGEVSWDPSTDFRQGNPFPVGPLETPQSGSQASLQRVYPVATGDPSRFETARSSVVSGSEPYVSSRPGALPLQQPQPIAPVSQSVYEPTYPALSDSVNLKKASSSSSHGRSKSLAEAALAGVAVAAAGAAIASERRDERSDRRRDSDRDDRIKRRDSERKETRDDREERRERRREKERQKGSSDGLGSERTRERRYDDPRYDDREVRREKRREPEERQEGRYDDPYNKDASSSTRVPVDPFQYQVADDAFETPKSESPIPRKADPVPTVVTVDREPDFSRMRISSIREQVRDHSDPDEDEQNLRGRDPREKDLNDPESSSQGVGRSAADIAAAVAAASAERARRANERRSDRRDAYDSRDYKSREKGSTEESQSKSKPERDPIQEEADRAYREIVMARKIASQVIRSRTPSPNRSVVEKYEKDDAEEEEEIVRIVTPPGMEDEREKKKGPYDAPNADFKLDLVLEDPRHLRNGSIPHIDFDTDGLSLKLDPDASKPRPFLNLVRPTPTPSPAPETQAARSEPTNTEASMEREAPKSAASDVAVESKDNGSSPASAATPKGVTWGENETKHYEVESPHEHKDEFVSSSEVQTHAKEVQQPKPSRESKRSGWGAVVAGITGAGIGAAVASASGASKPSKSRGVEDEQHDKPPTTVEPRTTIPEQSTASQIPGAFNDDLDFTATVAAGLQDTGFDPNIVINDPSFRRRESPPGTNELSREERGEASRHGESYTPRDIGEEPESFSESQQLSKKEQRKRDRATQRQGSQSGETNQADQPIVADELVEEPESYSGSSKKSKSKKSKRESSTFDDAEDMPRQSRRISIPVDAFEDLRNGEDEWDEPKKSKKKSKRDSEGYDSPSRSIPSEAASEFDTPSSKKSKSKSRRKSGSYDPEPDPTEVSLPPSTPSEVSRDGDEAEARRSKKSSSRDDEDRRGSRSVVSADDPRYDEEPRKSKKKSRSSTKDEFDDVGSVASAPVDDEFEYSKSRKKDKGSGGGFFGIFGSKSKVDAGEESPKMPKDDPEEIKKTRKSKRDSVQDEPTTYYDGASKPRSSSNGNGRSNGSHHLDDQDGGSRSNGDTKKSQDLAESTSAENDSFLGKAGILGAGAGLAGVAIAVAAQHHRQSKANLDESNVALEPTHSDRSALLLQYGEIFDPEIVQRRFRPSIDPQYGDLLPLPPSGPTSPNLESIDHLPKLPDSRPDTPEAERFPRDRAMSSTRKTLQEGPVKSPSQSAVPLKFIMGNRSLPSSPGAVRSSPLQSPVMQHQDSLAFPRNRSRPTSWDSTKEYKPLYLVETNRRSSIVLGNEPEETLPELPPSQRTSRSSSELDFHDAVAHQSPEQPFSDEPEHSTRPLSIDTAIPFAGETSELLDSQQSTPKAGMQPEDVEPTRGDVQEPLSDAASMLPSLQPTSSLLVGSGDPATSVEEEATGLRGVAEAALSSSIGYFASSPSHRLTSQAWLNEMASSPSIQRHPSPVEPMTKDRSSYLLQSSPLSKKADDEEAFDPNLDPATNRQLFAYSESDSLQSIQKREGDGNFGSTRHAHLDGKDELDAPLDTLSASSHSLPAADAMRDLAEDNAMEQTVPEEDLAAPSASADVEQTDEYVPTTSKKNKKKDKKRGNQLSRPATADYISVPEAKQETQLDDLKALDAESIEDPSSKRAKKSKKKDRAVKSESLYWEPEEGESALQPPGDSLPHPSQDQFEEQSTVNEFATVKTKGKQRKGKKKSPSSLSIEPEDEGATLSSAYPEPVQETSREAIDPEVAPDDSKPAEPKTGQDLEPAQSFEHDASQSLQGIESKKSQDILEELSTSRDIVLGEGKEDENKSSTLGVEGAAITEPLSREAPMPENVMEHSLNEEGKKDEEGISRLPGIDKDTESTSAAAPQELEDADDFLMTTSKKSKKKGKKSQAKKLDDVSAFDNSGSTGPSVGQADDVDVTRSAKALDDDFEQAGPSGSKESKKKSKKSEAWDQESEPQNVAQDHATTDISLTTVNDRVATELATSSESTSPKTAYYPSASILHSQHSHQSSEAASKGYFPSTAAVFPIAIAGAALVGSSYLENTDKEHDVAEIAHPLDPVSKSADADEPRLPQPETEPKPVVSDGLKAGYNSEQLRLARQLQEEFGIGSKKSKKDKKKRQSLPVTPDREASRSRATDDVADIQPRARSLSIGPSGAAEMVEETPAKEEPSTTYSEDQLELARQLKAEFGSGDKKSKKDKKKRQGLSRSATFDEQAIDSGAEASQPLTTEPSTHPVMIETSNKGDGFAAGYQEDQLSLARQLQEEFGSGSKKSKKDKKEKKRQSLSQTPPQESETASDYIGEPLQSSGIDLLQNDDAIESLESSTINKDITRDGLAVGYSTDQLDLARQLKEEFASGSKGSKKDKKDKKRKSLPRNNSEEPPDDVQDTQLPPDVDAETSTLEIAEVASNELTAAYPADDFTFATKKKGKKGKKRDSLVPKLDDKNVELFPRDEDAAEQEPEPVPAETSIATVSVDPEDDFTPITKKSNKGKKGKKQENFVGFGDKEVVGQGMGLVAAEESNAPVYADPEDEFVPATKKSKKGKKGKKQESGIESDDVDPAPASLSKDNDVDPDVAPLPGTEINEPAAEDLAEEFAFVSKKYKKGKKEKKPADTADDDLSLETASKDKDVKPDVDPASVESLEQASRESTPAEKELATEETKGVGEGENKEDPAEEYRDSQSFADQVMALHNASGLESAKFEAGLSEDLAPAPAEGVLFTTKKSKKGKKKQQIPDPVEPVEPVEPSFDPLEPQLLQAEQTPGIDTATEMPGKENELSAQEPGEGEESHYVPQGLASDETPKHPDLPTSKQGDDIRDETVDKELQSQDQASQPRDVESISRNVETTVEAVPSLDLLENTAEDFGFTTKKSKKDKKKRKGLSTVDPDEGSRAIESDLGIGPTETSETSLPAKEVVGNLETGDAAPIDKLQDKSFARDEPVEEPVDEWAGFSTKMSKTEKKKRKSGVSTPAEASTSLIEEEKPVEREELEDSRAAWTSVDDKISAPAVSQSDPLVEPVNEQSDEWSSFSTKKSKKDKKNRKSGLSTTTDASTTLLEKEKAVDKEELTEPILEPSSVDDNISALRVTEDDGAKEPETADEPTVDAVEFTTKRSKKDKKRPKKSGLSTPADDALTADRAIDCIPEVQPDEPQLSSLELQDDPPDSIAEQGISQELPDETTEDTDFGFRTKKSKKNKKSKRESQAELVSSASLSDRNLEGQGPFTSEQASENVPSYQEAKQPADTPTLEAKPGLISTEDREQVADQAESKSELSDPASSKVEWKALKHDKRKRQATVDASVSNESRSANVPPISWADEVEEAEIERQLPVIEDIGKDESLSHIASTTHVDDFSRPAKKGKKGKKKRVELTGSAPATDSSSTPLESSSVRGDSMQEPTKAPGLLAAADSILGGAAALLGNFDDKKTEASSEQPDESRELSSKDQGLLSTPPPNLDVESRTEERGQSFEEGPSEHEPTTPLNTTRYSHPGSSSLPVVREESPEPTATRVHVQEIDDVNRDSAFVTESPVPQHRRGFSEDIEYNRDSGVHLRESSPYEKARTAATTDDALARMSWPAIDEERETVDLQRSQRPKAEQNTRSLHDTEETHWKERSQLQDVSDTGFSRTQKSQEVLPAHHTLGHHSLSPGQLHSGEPAPKYSRFSSPKHEDDTLASHRDVHTDSRDDLPSQRGQAAKPTGLHRSPAIYVPSMPKEDSIVKQRVQRIESPDFSRSQRSSEKYGDLAGKRSSTAENSSPTASGLGITGAPLGFAASRIASQEQRPSNTKSPTPSPRSLSNINRLRSPDQRTPVRPDSVGSNRSSGTPPLRRSDRRSGDLRSLSQRSKPDLAKEAELAGLTSVSTTSVNTANPTANEGRVRAKEMADVYVSLL